MYNNKNDNKERGELCKVFGSLPAAGLTRGTGGRGRA